MPDRPPDDRRIDLTALTQPLARAARLALLLDERQPDALRADVLDMRAERRVWTRTQLDDGGPLPKADWDAERWSAETAAALAWLRRRLASLPASAELATWLAGASPRGPAAPGARWLDLPPLVGPPPGAVDPSLAARLVGVLRAVGWP